MCVKIFRVIREQNSEKNKISSSEADQWIS